MYKLCGGKLWLVNDLLNYLHHIGATIVHPTPDNVKMVRIGTISNVSVMPVSYGRWAYTFDTTTGYLFILFQKDL